MQRIGLYPTDIGGGAYMVAAGPADDGRLTARREG